MTNNPETVVSNKEKAKNERKELKEVKDKYKYKVAQLKLKYEGVISELKKQLDNAKVERIEGKLTKQASMVPDLVQQFELMKVD